MLDWQGRFDEIGDVRGLGAMVAIELVHDRESKNPAPELVAAVCEEALRNGLLLMSAGIYSNVDPRARPADDRRRRARRGARASGSTRSSTCFRRSTRRRENASAMVGEVIAGRYELEELVGKGGMSSVYRAQRPAARAHGRDQAPARALLARRGLRRALPARGARGGAALAPEHRHRDRPRRGGRPPVHRLRVRRRPEPEAARREQGTAAGADGARARDRDRACARLRARERARPPRRQAAERAARERRREGDRLRDRALGRRPAGPDPDRDGAGDERLHRARAGERPAGRARSATSTRSASSSTSCSPASRRTAATASSPSRCGTSTTRCRASPRVRPDVPLRLDAALRRAMAKDPRDRFASMADFVAELEAVLGELGRARQRPHDDHAADPVEPAGAAAAPRTPAGLCAVARAAARARADRRRARPVPRAARLRTTAAEAAERAARCSSSPRTRTTPRATARRTTASSRTRPTATSSTDWHTEHYRTVAFGNLKKRRRARPRRGLAGAARVDHDREPTRPATPPTSRPARRRTGRSTRSRAPRRSARGRRSSSRSTPRGGTSSIWITKLPGGRDAPAVNEVTIPLDSLRAAQQELEGRRDGAGAALLQALEGELVRIAQLADEVDLPPGKTLDKEGARGREFFVLLEGAADVQRNGQLASRRCGGGDFFGEIALVTDAPRTATVTTTLTRARARDHRPRVPGAAARLAARSRARCSRRSPVAALGPTRSSTSACARRSAALEREVDRALEQLGVRDSRRLEQLRVDARRGEAGHRVQLVDQHLAVVADEAVDARDPLALGGDERLDGELLDAQRSARR